MTLLEMGDESHVNWYGSIMTCRACGVDAPDDLCTRCSLAADYLHPDPDERSLSLRIAVTDQRPQVFVAMLRGGGLWEQSGQAREILDWMVEEQTEVLFQRWLAEDSVYGGLAIAILARDDRARCLTRAPLWISPTRPGARAAAATLIKATASDLPWLYSLAFRLASTADTTQTRTQWQQIFPSGAALLGVRLIMNSGRASESWLPTAEQLNATPRRWPIERFEGAGVVVCSLCGECLPGEGACRWCGTDPADEPPTVLALPELFLKRGLCHRCAIDITTAASPVLCPGCGVSDPME